MKIALLHNAILPPKTYGGIERIVMILAKKYTQMGHEVVLIARRGTRDVPYQVIELDAEYNGEDIDAKLPADLDFLHSHQPLRYKPKVPFLVTIHGNGSPTEHYWPNTNFLSQSHARNHNAKYFVYNGIDPQQYPFEEKKQDYFVFLARTTWRVKNVKTAIAWANDLGVKLEIMGGSGVSRSGIRYHGLVDDKLKMDLLKNAKALIYPTNWDEPCAAAPLEALACGTPVITSANGCMPELVREGTGVVCRTYEDLLKAPGQLSQEMSKNCRTAIEGFFSLDRMAKDYMALIEKILQVGELDHSPRYNFTKSSVQYLFKPTVFNRARLALTGKI